MCRPRPEQVAGKRITRGLAGNSKETETPNDLGILRARLEAGEFVFRFNASESFPCWGFTDFLLPLDISAGRDLSRSAVPPRADGPHAKRVHQQGHIVAPAL